MKELFSLFIIIAGVQLQASTLNIPDGDCRGAGALVSPFMLVPDLPFTSVRSFGAGTLKAVSTVSILGFQTAVSANLYFSLVDVNTYEILDLDRPVGDDFVIVGKAHCAASECTLEARVKRGELYLRETLVRTPTGFSIKNGFQSFNGIQNSYEAEFQCDFKK